MLTRIHHVGILVPDWEAGARLMLDQFGFRVAEGTEPGGRIYAPSNTMIYLVEVGTGGAAIEVLVPLDATSGIARHLAKRGPGLHHICFASDALAADARTLANRGLEQIASDHDGNEDAYFFHPRASLGILTELVSDTSGVPPAP